VTAKKNKPDEMSAMEWNLAMQSFEIEAESIRETMKRTDRETFGHAVSLLSTAVCIATSGCGHSGIACMHFAHSLCCVEKSARFLSPSEALHGAAGFLHQGDVCVLASRGGETDELLPIAEICRSKGVHIIGVTEKMDSSLAKKSDVVLTLVITRETDRFDSQGTTSFAVLNAVFDALQVSVMERIGFSNKQFALIHPGGAVGKRLNK